MKTPARATRRLFALAGPVLASAWLSTSCLNPDMHKAANHPEAQAAEEESGASVPTEAYEWKSVVIDGGGFVTGLLYSPVEKGILYARTDVGGAYRYDPKNGSWIPITDFIGHDKANLLGIESFAVDPEKAGRLYLATGMYTADWAPSGAFMRSDDRGESFEIFPVDFKLGGNDLSRSNGERLAVDPKKPNVLYFGSRRSGLWKSEDEAETWKKIENFPVKDDAEKGLGLVFVLFDPTSGKKGEETPDIYVGSQVDGKIYHSGDAGKTWAAVPNQPEQGFNPRRAVFDSDGTLYVAYALGDSPYALKDGAVHRYEPKAKKWTDITPLKPSEEDTFGYGGITVDPSNPGTLVTTTMDRWTKGAEIFRSTDRGKSWKPVMSTAVLDGGGVKHVYHHREKLGAPQWMGDIKIDPFDPNTAMIVEGGGVWATKDLTAVDAGKPAHWSFHSKNLEETVPRDLVSPPEGAPLLSVMLDACGFRHDDLGVSPERGIFKDPMCASSEDMDFAEKKPSIMARVGAHPWDGTKGPRGALSTDGGASWKQFGSEPSGSDGMGSVAVSADGAVLLWAPRDTMPVYSKDGGKTWVKIAGIPEVPTSPNWAPWNIRLASDRVNPKKFYLFHAMTGTVFVSEDGGANFTEGENGLRSMPDYELHFSTLRAVPGHEGHLWITTKDQLSRSTDSGKSFEAIDGVEEAHGIGFGHPPPGKSYPALYFSGKVGGVTGFFRSDDEGESFVRINDDDHQYGGATVIIGDPRVYGRVYVGPGGRGIVYGEPKK